MYTNVTITLEDAQEIAMYYTFATHLETRRKRLDAERYPIEGEITTRDVEETPEPVVTPPTPTLADRVSALAAAKSTPYVRALLDKLGIKRVNEATDEQKAALTAALDELDAG